jgi:hypothetical protein
LVLVNIDFDGKKGNYGGEDENFYDKEECEILGVV